MSTGTEIKDNEGTPFIPQKVWKLSDRDIETIIFIYKKIGEGEIVPILIDKDNTWSKGKLKVAFLVKDWKFVIANRGLRYGYLDRVFTPDNTILDVSSSLNVRSLAIEAMVHDLYGYGMYMRAIHAFNVAGGNSLSER